MAGKGPSLLIIESKYLQRFKKAYFLCIAVGLLLGLPLRALLLRRPRDGPDTGRAGDAARAQLVIVGLNDKDNDTAPRRCPKLFGVSAVESESAKEEFACRLLQKCARAIVALVSCTASRHNKTPRHTNT